MCVGAHRKRGPLVITLQLRLVNPTQRDLQKLMRLGPAIAQLLHVESVRISDSAQGILVEVPSPAPLTSQRDATHAIHTRACDCNRCRSATRPVSVDMKNHGALFWVGPSRRGKTRNP